MKTCKKCGVEKPLTAFHKHSTTRDRLNPWCGECKSAWLREHRRKNREYWRAYGRRRYRANAEANRNKRRAHYAANREREARRALAWRIKRDFGITLEEYDALVAQPCALCRTTENIVLDHCHDTNRVRGPLCQTCNKALGLFGDDPDRLRAAAKYLEKGI